MGIGIYVHLPFCRAKCTYCAFAISTDRRHQDQYHAALLAEIGRSPLSGATADTIYLGGGTPSLTPSGQLAELISTIRDRFAVANDAEITIEANPEDVDPNAVATWRSLGVNRISIGIQSFHDAELVPLGRGHSSAHARAAVECVLVSGARVSLDLIVGLPNQTRASFAESLRWAIESGAGHLSLYMLDLEADSTLESQVTGRRVTLPDEESVVASYMDALNEISRAGFHQYEISNFAKPGEESRHNLKYWSREPYLGFGLGAHSFDGNERFANTRNLDEYISRNGSLIVFRETPDTTERTRELIFLGLRQAQGLRYSELIALRGEEASEWISRGLSEGWLHTQQDRVAFTGPGFLLSNEYISQLF